MSDINYAEGIIAKSQRYYNKKSPYRNLKILVDKDGNQFLESKYFRLYDEDVNDKYHKVQQGEEHRIDLVAKRLLGDERFWWVIAAYNNICNPFYLEAGTVLRIPDLGKLYRDKTLLG